MFSVQKLARQEQSDAEAFSQAFPDLSLIKEYYQQKQPWLAPTTVNTYLEEHLEHIIRSEDLFISEPQNQEGNIKKLKIVIKSIQWALENLNLKSNNADLYRAILESQVIQNKIAELEKLQTEYLAFMDKKALNKYMFKHIQLQ